MLRNSSYPCSARNDGKRERESESTPHYSFRHSKPTKLAQECFGIQVTHAAREMMASVNVKVKVHSIIPLSPF
jgi:hypothetical protein